MFRPYQQEANDAIVACLATDDRCLVKMFCGTGKSVLMRHCTILTDDPTIRTVAYVFPSLSLIDQFYRNYMKSSEVENLNNLLIVCSLETETDPSSWDEAPSCPSLISTDPTTIQHFVTQKETTGIKWILVTYQSYATLIENLNGVQLDVCMYDEAHNATGETFQKYIFHPERSQWCRKQIFFTATPRNANGIVMYNPDAISSLSEKQMEHCGKLAFDYSYFRGVMEGYVNPFEIRVDFFTDDSSASMHSSIARSVLETGNRGVLTFHADVNADRDTSVKQFVRNPEKFRECFLQVLRDEFPDQWQECCNWRLRLKGLDASSSAKQRRYILDQLDTLKNKEVLVLSSCKTIGEGVDTKSANMCVFVDPKTSSVDIIQNIGRIVRKSGETQQKSTVLIPCRVNREKYLTCPDAEACDEAIRADLQKNGDFSSILNVLSALRQEDEELYEACLYYPNSISPMERQKFIEAQGFEIGEKVGEGQLEDYLEMDDEEGSTEASFLQASEDENNMDVDEEEEYSLAKRLNRRNQRVEIHTNSIDNSVRCVGAGNQLICQLYQVEEDEGEGELFYLPIHRNKNLPSSTTSSLPLQGITRKQLTRIVAHYDSDVRVLWKMEDFSTSKMTETLCSGILDCEVIVVDPMDRAMEVAQRCRERVRLGRGKLLPTSWKKPTTADQIQEKRDYCKLRYWRMALEGKGKCRCSDAVRDFLDRELPGWREVTDIDVKAMQDAEEVAKRGKERVQLGRGKLLPTCWTKPITADQIQETKDSKKLHGWRQALKGRGGSRCSDEVRDFLDRELPGWREVTDLDTKAMQYAEEVAKRGKERVRLGRGKLLPKCWNKPTTAEQIQETKDYCKLRCWRQALEGKGDCRCSDEVRDFLDREMPGWREVRTKRIKKAEAERDTSADSVNPKKTTKKQKTTHSTTPSLSLLEQRAHAKAEISLLHQKYKTMTPAHLHEYFQSNREEWKRYHAIAEQNEAMFADTDELPRNRMITMLKQLEGKRQRTVVDMGCGKALIAQKLREDKRFLFLNIDHQKEEKDDDQEEHVIVKDMTHTGLDTASVDLCILCLAMWGPRNACRQYLTEAYRLLETSGMLWIAEPTKRWTPIVDEGNNPQEGGISDAIDLVNMVKEAGFTVTQMVSNKFTLLTCVKGIM